MSTFNILLILIILSSSLLGIGFQFRKHGWGIAIMWVGALLMLSIIAYKIFDVTHIPS